jgi:hypothetical protein
MKTAYGSATPSHRANIGYSAVPGANRNIVGSARPIPPVKKVTAAAIQGTNIAKAARSEQSDAFGTAYPVAVVDTHTDGNRMTLAESGDRFRNGSNRKDGSECKNSGDRMQFHVPLQVTKNHNPQAEPVHQSLERRHRQTHGAKAKRFGKCH